MEYRRVKIRDEREKGSSERMTSRPSRTRGMGGEQKARAVDDTTANTAGKSEEKEEKG